MAGCESMRVGQSATVQFGVVQSAEQVTLDSKAAQGALLGGTIGVLAGGNARGAITGAAVGGVAGAAATANRTGTQYTVRMLDGSSTRIVSDQHQIKVNDCVAIERVGNSANIRRESPNFCDPANTEAVNQVSDSVKAQAMQCETAKRDLAAAERQQSLDLAIRRVELLCDD
jgi:outer membrane lipoprotein SlyB